MINIDNGFTLNLETIKTILLTIFNTNPSFPIDDLDTLREALGGSDQLYYINENVGELPASVLAEKTFENNENLEEPNQIIDSLLGESFINIFTKTKLIEIITNLSFPIDTKDQLTKSTQGLLIFGIPMGAIAEKMDYPINKPEQIYNRIKLIDQKLFDANTDMVPDIQATKSPSDKTGESSAESEEMGEQLLKFSESYLIEEDKPKICFEIFNLAEASNFTSLCISRTHPQQLHEKYNLKPDSKILWLTDNESTQEEIIKPSLESLMFKIEEWIKDNSNSFLIIDGLEYLISINNFNPVLQFIRTLKDKISECKTVFIIPVSTGAIDEKQVKLIERELEIINIDLNYKLPEEESKAQPDSDIELRSQIKIVVDEGKNAYRNQQYERAIEIYENGLKLDPDNTELQFLKKTVNAKIKDIAMGPTSTDVGKVVESKIDSIPEPDAEPSTEPGTEPSAEPSAEPGAELDVESHTVSDDNKTNLDQSEIEPTPDNKPETEFKIEDTKFELGNTKIEQLGKKLQEKVKVLQNLTKRPNDLPEGACKSCEGTGECYWCHGSGKCSKCTGAGKTEDGNECPECKGSGNCHSCNSAGKCHWCNGSGKKNK